MSLDRLININVDNSEAQKKLDKMLKTLRSLDNQMSSGSSSGSSAASGSNGSTQKKIKPLKEYSGVMTDLARDIAKTNGAISAQERALLKYDNAVRNANKNLQEQKYTQEQANKAIDESKKRYDDRIASIKNTESAISSSKKTWTDYNGILSKEARTIQESIAAKDKSARANLELDKSIKTLNQKYSEGTITQKEYRKALKNSGANVVESISSGDKLSESNNRFRKALENATKSAEKKSKALAKAESTTKSGRKTLLDYTGVLSNETRLLQRSTGGLSYAEAATLRYDTAVRSLNKSAAQGNISQEGLARGLRDAEAGYQEAYKGATKLDAALAKGRGGFRAMRGAVSQLSYQFQDIAVQAQMGTAATTIFTQQFPQIASVFGPAGAIVGVIGAIAGAIAGPLITSMFGAEDATKQLEKSMESLNDVVKENDKGLYSYTETINKLKRADNEASDIQLAFAILEAEKGVKNATDGISESLESATGSWYNFITQAGDVNVDRVAKAFTRLKNEGFELSDILSGIGSNQQGRGSRLGFLTVSDLSGIRQSVNDLNETFGISKNSALEFLNAITTMDSSQESFKQLQSTLNGIIQEQESSSTVTKEQSNGFITLAKDISDAALQGESFSKFLEAVEGKSIGQEYVPLASSISEARLQQEKLNASVSVSSDLVSQLYDIEKSYNELAKESFESGSKSVSSEQARVAARRDFIGAVKDSVAEEDTFIKRQEIILGLTEKLKNTNAQLTKEEISSIKQYAQEQNFVYKSQLSLFSAIGQVIDESTEKTIESANQTKAWSGVLSDQFKIIGDIFEQGAKGYKESVGSYNESLQGMVTSTFSKLEDAIVNFAVNGKGSFKDFANSVLEDLLRIQIQQQLVGISGFLTGGGSTGGENSTAYFNTSAEAKGGVWGASGRVNRYAKGGITGMANTVQSTPKRFANGSGLLGEAGQPEGIFPLTRTSGGDLGVKAIGGNGASNLSVQVNINDQTGGQVQYENQGTSQNSDGSISIDLVAKMVNKSIASGKTDSVMKSRFGLKRRGV